MHFETNFTTFATGLFLEVDKKKTLKLDKFIKYLPENYTIF